MKYLMTVGLVGVMSGSVVLDAGVSPAVAQAVLSAQKPAFLATPEGRLQIGRGKDYVPSTVEFQALFTELEGSMKKRRDFAWKVVEQVLQPVKIKLLDGVTEVEVPLWQTWYEGRPSRASANQELFKVYELYFKKLKPVLAANPNADVRPVIAETIKDFSSKDLSNTLSDDNLSSVLHQLADAEAGRLVGQGTTMFSPSFVEHALKESRKIDECKSDVANADRDPPSPTQFSHCVEEFPRSAVMIKTSWRQLSNGIPRHDTSASAMSGVIRDGTWPGPGRPDATPPVVNPDRSQIYTNISSQGTEWALVGIHFVTKDVREWVWVSLWWDPDASKDFGADRPASIEAFNGGVWKNYKMCANSSFAERDPQPWASYTGAQATLGASIKAVYDAIQVQIDSGAIERPQDYQHFFRPEFIPNPLSLPGNLGPWPAPHNKQTSWCSNPNIEQHAANARTSCIGCHQIAFTRNERRNNEDAAFIDAMTGDVPQFGRSLARKNFTAEFSWSFEIEFKPAIALGKELAKFNWPTK